MSMFEYLGSPICKRCGFTDIRALQIDHVYGGGHKKTHNASMLLKQIKENPNDFQILCANCNWIKRVENNECTGRPVYD